MIHSLFNVFATMLLLPFGKGLEKLACLTIRDDVQPAEVEEERKELQLLDSRFLEKPAFAWNRVFMWQTKWRKNPSEPYSLLWISCGIIRRMEQKR